MDRLRVEQQADTRSAAPEISPGGVTGLVRTFLMELSEKQRAMMDLVDFQGLTPAEASSMLGLNQNTARVHLLRARRRIRTRILEDHPTLVEDLR